MKAKFVKESLDEDWRSTESEIEPWGKTWN